MSKTITCPVRVNRGWYAYPIWQPCGRKVVDEGLCKIHLNAKKKREEKERLWKQHLDNILKKSGGGRG